MGGCPCGMGGGVGSIQLCVRVLIQLPWQRCVLWTDVKRRLVGDEAAVISMVCVWGGGGGGVGGGKGDVPFTSILFPCHNISVSTTVLAPFHSH